jgi:hypothetical protein
MKRRLGLTLGGLVLFASSLLAQSPIATPTDRLGWNQAAETLIEVQTYTYRYYPDGAPSGVVLSNVTCNGTTSPFTCSVLFPTFSNGTHTLMLTAANTIGESPKSGPFDFVFGAAPSTPASLRVIKP